jgi:type IV pilus assembly protein PilY1
MTASKLLFDHWDVEGGNDPNLGHSIGQPVIGRLADGDFYAIFGNGRDSFYRCPVLYVVRLRDGLVRRVPTGGRNLAATCGAAPNGLGRPSLYDTDRQGESGYRITDFVYAGDLQGNVWRFDLRSLDVSAEPPTGASAQLLFTAQNNSSEPQPITGTIELGPAPSGVIGNPRPVMLWFGTGRYLATADADSTTVQSMYGMVDRHTTPVSATTATIQRSDLQSQTANLSGDLAGTISGTPVNYPGGQHGWYFDLPRSGERMTGLPLLQPGRLLFATYVPEARACYASGQSWIFAVDPYHGRSLGQRIFVRSPSVDFLDATVGVVRSFVAVDAGDRAFVYLGGSGSGGNSIQREEVKPAKQGGASGRVSWREIVR